MLRNGESVDTKLDRLARKARTEPAFRFTSLFHLLNVELLRGCFERLRGDAAAGIDQVTKEEYGLNLDSNLANLAGRLRKMAYIPLPVRRKWIPKPGSDKLRPLGIPCLEDKIVQAALVRILNPIYEQAFVDGSYGFRPGRGCHDALRALRRTVDAGNIHYLVEADIKGFFDHVDHEWLVKFLQHRIGDSRVLRMIVRFLKAGVVDDGTLHHNEEGTPQGGVISPLLANVYLHYALDLWFGKVFRPTCIGEARLIRYADDFVVCFQTGQDARRFREELTGRLAKFNLEVEPSKTKVLEVGPMASARAKRRGERKPATFDFLGFTHFMSTTRDGKRFRMKRVTAGKRFRRSLMGFKEWLRQATTLPTRELWEGACRRIRGHFAYYGVTDNCKALVRFFEAAKWLLWKRLNRRGKRRSVTWPKFTLMERAFPLPKPRLQVSLY